MACCALTDELLLTIQGATCTTRFWLVEGTQPLNAGLAVVMTQPFHPFVRVFPTRKSTVSLQRRG